MFFVKDLEHRIDLHPSFFTSSAESYIRTRLYQEMEGTNTGTQIIVAVISIDEISEPKIAPGTGFAQFQVGFRAIVWRPFRGEVVDGLVGSVLHGGFFVDVGGLSVFVSKAVSRTLFAPFLRKAEWGFRGYRVAWADLGGSLADDSPDDEV